MDPEQQATGRFLAKSDGIVSGLAVVEQVFAIVGKGKVTVEWTVKDGDFVRKGTVFGHVKGPAQLLLNGERVALNFIQRMSGIATMTRRFMDCRVSGSKLQILDTRKTVPGLRMVDKLAVRHGGGTNHRVGLYDMMMIKDNHVTAAGGITQALQKTRKYFQDHPDQTVPVEIEVRTLDEVKELIADGASGVQRIMLDNMVSFTESGEVDASMLQEALELLKSGGLGHIETEASGNMNLDTVRAVSAFPGLTFVSIGALTHSVTAMDISLKIRLTNE